MGTGTCTVHSWSDGADEDEADPQMGLRVGPLLNADPALYAQSPDDATTETPRRRGLRSYDN